MSDTITGGHATVFKPTIWSKEVTKSFEDNRVMAKLVSRFDADIKEKGDIVKIPNFASLTATYKMQGSEVHRSANTNTTVTLTIDKWGAEQVVIEDIAKIQSSYPLMSYYAEKLGESLAELQDNDIMALYTSFANTAGATSNNVGLAKTFLLAGIRYLDSQNVPNKDRHMVIDAYGLEDIRQMDEFTRYDATGEAGKFGTEARMKFFNVELHMTNNCPVTTSLVTGLLFHKEAIALGEQRSIRTQYDYQPRTLDEAVVADILYGCIARRTNAAVRVQYGQ